ncbi:ImmA/IrrE family metallo-endopeptidase [Nitrospira sp. Nam74]
MSIHITPILDEFGIQSPADIHIEAIAYRYGLWLYQAPLSGAHGCLVRKGDHGIVVVDHSLSRPRHRFTIAHELGHFLLHKPLSLTPCKTPDNDILDDNHSFERQADIFAVKLLLPEKLFLSRVQDLSWGLDAIKTVAREFETSLTSTAFRYVELSERPSAVVISDANHIVSYKKSDSFYEKFLRKGTRIPESSTSRIAYSKRAVAGIIAGYSNWDSSTCSLFHEQSIRLGRYEKVLTLIWK